MWSRLTLFQKQILSFIGTAVCIYLVAGEYWILYGSIFAMIAVHELGHLWCAHYLGYSTSGMFMTPLGGVALLNEMPKLRTHQFWIWWWGPCIGFLETLVLFLLNTFFIQSSEINQVVFLWALINYINFLPLFPLDGRRIACAIIAGKNEAYLQSTFFYVLTFISGVILISMGAWLFAVIVLMLGWQEKRVRIYQASLFSEKIDEETGKVTTSRIGWKNEYTPMTFKESVCSAGLYLILISGLYILALGSSGITLEKI